MSSASSVQTPALCTPLRIAVVGLGRRGMYHLERLSLRDDFVTVASHDADPAQAEVALGFSKLFHTDWHELLANQDVELVLIATPAATHASLAIEAFAAGKHVVVEKPLDLSTRKADAMLEASRRAGRMFSVVQNRRWDDDFRTALEAIRTNALGRLRVAKLIVWGYGVAQHRQRHGRHDGIAQPARGALLEFAADYFDQLLQLVGEQPHSLFAQTPDSVGLCGQSLSVFVNFRSGVTAQIDVHLDSFAPLRLGWILTGTSGGYKNFRCYTMTHDGEIFDTPLEPIPTDGDSFYESLVHHLCDGVELPVTAEQARHVVVLIDAARKSVASGQVVQIEDVEGKSPPTN